MASWGRLPAATGAHPGAFSRKPRRALFAMTLCHRDEVMSFKLTYATMFDPPSEMHTRFETALRSIEAHTGSSHALFIGGRDVPGAAQFLKRSPIDERLALG